MATFEENILNLYGEKGRIWLNALPQIVEQLAKNWNLDYLKAVDNLSYNYVLSGFQHQQPIILKLNPQKDRLETEALTLKAFDGYGAISVLDQSDGALLMEQALPGYSLKSYFPDKEMESIEIVCNIIQRLQQLPLPKNINLPHIRNWLARLDHDENIPKQYVEKACLLKEQLLKISQKDVLLHGDLHHENILLKNDQWIVIDPHGIIGDPIYEIAAFIRNPIPDLLDSHNPVDLIKNRINTCAILLNIDAQLILQWCFVQAVLSWHWCLEDHSNPDYFKRLTEVYYSLT